MNEKIEKQSEECFCPQCGHTQMEIGICPECGASLECVEHDENGDKEKYEENEIEKMEKVEEDKIK